MEGRALGRHTEIALSNILSTRVKLDAVNKPILDSYCVQSLSMFDFKSASYVHVFWSCIQL